MNFLEALQSALLKNEIKNSLKRCKSPKDCLTVDIAKERSKTLKKEKEKQKTTKSLTTAFLLLLFLYREICILLEKISLYCYICITVFSSERLLER